MVTKNGFWTRGENRPDTDIADLEPSRLITDGGAETEIPSHPVGTDPCQISIENLGGITEAELTLPPGVSMLVGKNATNRSSLLRSLAAVLGGEQSAARLKTDAKTGEVTLSIGDETYTREYTHNGNSVHKHGETFTDEPALVDTFVALFASCPARRAVEHDGELRDILMKPVNTAEIRTRISELSRERDGLEETIQRATSRKKELPKLEEKRNELAEELEEVESEIDELEAVVEQIEETADETSETADLRSELEELRSDLGKAERRADEIKQQLEFRRSERADLVEQREERQAELEEFEDTATLENRIAELQSEIQVRKEKRETLSQAVEDLQSVIRANETILAGDVDRVGFGDDESVAAALDPDSQTVECWTCGETVERADISEQVETLRNIVAEQRTQRNELGEQISELEREKETFEKTLEEYRTTADRIDELKSRIDQHDEKIEQLEGDYEEQQRVIEQLEADIEAVEEEIEAVETDDSESTDEFVDAHKELTKLERTRGRLENQLKETESRIKEIEALDERRAEAERRHDELTAELEDLRGRIDQLETELVETLNSIMEDLIARLEYENIARVWLERQTADQGDSSFELHIVREADDGSVYEDTAATLSESEREVIGLVVALAGYLVHDIDRKVPFLLLDSMEMIDGNRLAQLLDYIETQTDVAYLSVALLPKDAESVEESDVLAEYTSIDFEAETA